MVLTPNTTGCAFVEPAALIPHWDLRLGTTDDTFLQLPRVFYPQRVTQKWPPMDHHLVRTDNECRYMDASRPAEWFQVGRSDQSTAQSRAQGILSQPTCECCNGRVRQVVKRDKTYICLCVAVLWSQG